MSADEIEWCHSPGLTPYPQAVAEMERRADAILAGEARELPRLAFVALLIALAAAQTLRWFTIGDAWRGAAGADADLREPSLREPSLHEPSRA